jgi:hypothetical protein
MVWIRCPNGASLTAFSYAVSFYLPATNTSRMKAAQHLLRARMLSFEFVHCCQCFWLRHLVEWLSGPQR